MSNTEPHAEELSEKESLILDAAVSVLARGGISAVSMRAVAKQAGVSLGLINYYFSDKTSLIAAALTRIGEQDALLVQATGEGSPADELRAALRRVVDPDYLRPEYLGLRLHLWSLAPIEPEFAKINHVAQARYRDGLTMLIANANPAISLSQAGERAADVLVIQNGIWLTSILIIDPDAIERSIRRCEQIAFDSP